MTQQVIPVIITRDTGGGMKVIEKLLRNQLKEFIDKYGYDLKISKIIFWNRDYAEYRGLRNGSGIIKLNPNQIRSKIKEDFWHEIGHAILHQYHVPRKMLNIFRDNCPNNGHSWYEKFDDEDGTPPPAGEVSWYGLVSGTESFCEVLSAWVCSGYKMHGRINYGPWSHSIDRDRELKMKIKRIQKILSLE